MFFVIHLKTQAETFEGRTQMNEIKFQSYKGFEKKWKLVTVRFREDTKEMRFTYANDIAWKTLKQKRIDITNIFFTTFIYSF